MEGNNYFMIWLFWMFCIVIIKLIIVANDSKKNTRHQTDQQNLQRTQEELNRQTQQATEQAMRDSQRAAEQAAEQARLASAPFEHGGTDMSQGNSFNNPFQ